MRGCPDLPIFVPLDFCVCLTKDHVFQIALFWLQAPLKLSFAAPDANQLL